jgi:hypothetical protein
MIKPSREISMIIKTKASSESIDRDIKRKTRIYERRFYSDFEKRQSSSQHGRQRLAL